MLPAIDGEFLDIRAKAAAAARGVLEDEHRRCGRRLRIGRRASVRRIPSPSRSIPAATPRPRCEPMWTFTNRAPNVGAWRSSWASIAIDRSYESWVRSGQVHEIRRVDRDRSDIELARALAEGIELRRRFGPALPGRRVVVKICMAFAPMSRARSTALTMPVARGRCAPSRRPSGSIERIVRWRPWTRTSDEDPAFEARVIRSFIRDGRLDDHPGPRAAPAGHLSVPARPGLHRGPGLSRRRK